MGKVSGDLDKMIDVLPELPPETVVELEATAKEWQKRLNSTPGPEVLSTRQAADLLGWTPKRWRRWAKQDEIPGASQDETGIWRLPNEECRKLKREKLGTQPKGGRRGPQDRGGPNAGRSSSP